MTQNLQSRIAALKASGKGGARKTSHPDVIHYLVDQLKSEKGSGEGFSVKSLAAWLTDRGYSVKGTQIHGMIYSESAQKAHERAIERFTKALKAGDKEAVQAVEKFLPSAKELAA